MNKNLFLFMLICLSLSVQATDLTQQETRAKSYTHHTYEQAEIDRELRENPRTRILKSLNASYTKAFPRYQIVSISDELSTNKLKYLVEICWYINTTKPYLREAKTMIKGGLSKRDHSKLSYEDATNEEKLLEFFNSKTSCTADEKFKPKTKKISSIRTEMKLRLIQLIHSNYITISKAPS